jgi:hypothetical protein
MRLTRQVELLQVNNSCAIGARLLALYQFHLLSLAGQLRMTVMG